MYSTRRSRYSKHYFLRNDRKNGLDGFLKEDMSVLFHVGYLPLSGNVHLLFSVNSVSDIYGTNIDKFKKNILRKIK